MPTSLDAFDPFAKKGKTLDDFDPFAAPPTQATPAPAPIARPSGLIRRVVGDTAVDLGRGIIGVGESAVGLANLATGGYAGKGLEAIGYDPAKTKEMIAEGYSPERVKANQEVADTKGFLPTLGAMIERPSTILGAVAESAPQMLGGGGIARAGAAGLERVGGSLLGKAGVRQQLAALPKTIAGRIGLAAAGEGAMQAGSAAEQTRQQTDDGLLTAKQAGAAIASGIGTAAITAASGGVAKKLGIADVDTLLAGGNTQAVTGAAKTKVPDFIKRGLKGVVSEGILEELPQSMQEQMWQNVALDKPVMEGVGEAGAAGLLTGAAQGGAVAAISRPGKPAANGDVRPDTSIDVSQLPTLDENGLNTQNVQNTQNGTSDFGNVTGGVQSTEADAAELNASQPAPTLADGAPIPDPNAGTLSKAVNVGVDTGAVPVVPFPDAVAGSLAGAANIVAPQEVAQEQAPPEVPAPWVDAITGEMREASDGELKQYIHDSINQMSDRGVKRSAVDANLWNLGVTRERAGEVWKEVTNERKTGLTAPSEASNERPISQQSELDSVGLRSDAVPVQSGSTDEAGSLAGQVAGQPAEVGQRAAEVPGDVAGTQAEAVGQEVVPKRAPLNVRMGDQEFAVSSVEDASAKFLQLRDQQGDIGGMPRVDLIDESGRPVAFIGHNGEVVEQGGKKLYDPQTPNRYGTDAIDATPQPSTATATDQSPAPIPAIAAAEGGAGLQAVPQADDQTLATTTQPSPGASPDVLANQGSPSQEAVQIPSTDRRSFGLDTPSPQPTPEGVAGQAAQEGSPAALRIAREASVPAELIQARDAAQARQQAASEVMATFPTGDMGLTPDAVKATPEWRAAKAESDKAMIAVRAANSAVTAAMKAAPASEVTTARKAAGLPRVVRKAEAIKFLRKKLKITERQALDAFNAIDRNGLKEGTRLGDDLVAHVETAKNAPKPVKTPKEAAPRKPLDLLKVIARSGGLDRKTFRKLGVEASEMTRRAGFNYLFRKQNGMTMDGLQELMQQEGYLPKDPESGQPVIDHNDVFDLFDRAFRSGEDVFAEDQAQDVAEFLARRQESLDEYRDEMEGTREWKVITDEEFEAMQAVEIADLTDRAYDLGAKDSDIVGATFDAENSEILRNTLQRLVGRLERNKREADATTARRDGASRNEPRQADAAIPRREEAAAAETDQAGLTLDGGTGTEPDAGFSLAMQTKSDAVADDEAKRTIDSKQTGMFATNTLAADTQGRDAPAASVGGGLFGSKAKEAPTKPKSQMTSAEIKAREAKPEKLLNHSWDAVKLSEYSHDQLNELREQVQRQHPTPRDAQGHPVNGIYLYDKEGRRKLDALAWAVTYKLMQSKVEKARAAAQIAANEPPPKPYVQRVETPKPVAAAPVVAREPAKPIEMTMAEWKTISKDFKGTIDGQRTTMRDGRMVAVNIIKEAKPETAAKPDGAGTIEGQKALFASIRSGEAGLAEYMAGWEALQANKEAITAELAKMTKAALLEYAGPRYKSDPKDRVARAAWDDFEDNYGIGRGLSFGMTSATSARDARAKQVANTTEADIAKYQAEVAERTTAYKERVAGLKEPKTLEDFANASRFGGGEAKLTPEQRATFDALRTEERRVEREREAKRNAVVRQVDTGTTGMTMVETKHTQKGHDLFVVKMEDRVERDVYTSLNAAAKRLGGHYSSFRGNGAIPGFTFTTKAAAEQFMAVREGNVDASAQQTARAETKAESRAESLAERANVIREKAEESLGRDRKDNTRKRAEQAASAEADARKKIALADTMTRIAEAIESGMAKMLAFVKFGTQVSLLETSLRSAHQKHLQEAGVSWEKAKDMPVSADSLTNATLPKFTMTRGDVASIARKIIGTRGGKAFGESLAKMVDYGDEYGKAVQANPYKFVLQKSKAGSEERDFAFFGTRKDAEVALSRSADKLRGAVVKIPDGKKGAGWAVALHPDQAIERKLWAPDYDTKITFNPDAAAKIMDLIGTADRNQTIPYWWTDAQERRKQFAKMGIERDFEYREALREYLGLREAPKGEDKVRKLERDLAGKTNVGIDFFPTPPAVVSRLIEQADIAPGMRVLEPSAGKGDIAEAIRNAAEGVTVDTVEMSATLREILEAKGFDTNSGDFLDFTPTEGYDRIVMNPPFNNDNGAAHVRHAYDMLNPGGRLVAVMGAGTRGKAEFDAWLDEVGGLAEPLPEGSFRSSFRPTGVATQVVEIEKASDAPAAITAPEPLESVEALDSTTRAEARAADARSLGMSEADIQSMNIIAREQSAADGMADSDNLGLRTAVNAALGGYPPVNVTYLRGEDGLSGIAKPGFIRHLALQRAGRSSRTAGLYLRPHETISGKPHVVIFTDVAKTPTRAAFTAAHEIAGHHGLRALLKQKLNTALANANQNPTVRAVADSMYKSRNMGKAVREGRKTEKEQRLLAIEEALADLAAANRTGNYDEIQRRHGVTVPLTQQRGLTATIARIVEAIKSAFRAKNVRFTDAQVYSLLENAWKAAEGTGSLAQDGNGSALETTEGDVAPNAKRIKAFRGMTREQFLGKPKITTNANARDLVPGELVGFKDVKAVPFMGIWARNHATDLTAKYTDSGAAVYDRDKIIASYHFGDTLVVDPRYRRRTVAEELVYQWRTRNPNAKTATHRTKASQALQEAVWDRIQRDLKRIGQPESAMESTDSQSPDEGSILESVDDIGDGAGMRGIFGKAKSYADKVASRAPQAIPDHFTPEQRAVAMKIDTFKPRETIGERWSNLKANAADRIAQKVIDQFRPLKALNMTAFMQAHLSKGTDGGVQAAFEYGPLKLDGGALNVKERTGGFKKVLQSLNGEHDQALMWIVGMRAEGLLADGREHYFTGDDIRALKSLNAGKMKDGRSRAAVYGKFAEQLAAYNSSFLDIAQEAGEINAEGRKVWEDGFYIPFYRAMESDGGPSVGQINGLSKQKIIERLVGSTETMGDPLENILANWSHILTASMRNMSANAALDSAVEIKVAEKLEETEKDAIWTMRDGQQVFWRVTDAPILEALNSLTFTGYDNPLMNAAGKFKRMLTTGVTISPTFRIRNLMRDALSAAATADVGYNPLKNIFDGMKATVRGSDTDISLTAGGGRIVFGTMNDGNQAGNIKRLVNMGINDNQIIDTQDKLKNAMRRVWDKWADVGDRSETVNRAVIYDRLRARGASHLEASYQARDLMNFTSLGSASAIRAMAQVLPFFNARLQGMDRLVRGAKADPRRFMAVAGTLGMVSALLFLANADDDDYKNMPDFVRDGFWTIKLGGTWLYIPKPFEVGAMASIVERATELAVSGDDYQAKDFAHTLTSILSSQLAMNPIPQIARPVMEASFNYDLFRMSPIDSMGQQNLAPQDRYNASTSAGAVAAGKLAGMSPQRMEHMVRGYFGWLGVQALNASDYMLRDAMDLASNPRRDLTNPGNIFVMGDFFKEAGDKSGKYVTRFYAMQGEIDELYASANYADKTGDFERASALRQDPLLRQRSIYKAGDKQISKINKQIKLVSNSRDLSAADKSDRIESLNRIRNSIARRVDEMSRGGFSGGIETNTETDDE